MENTIKALVLEGLQLDPHLCHFRAEHGAQSKLLTSLALGLLIYKLGIAVIIIVLMESQCCDT